ncbi:carbohydrate sulfotransferase 11-like isoform X2 [Eriocheir sinensis]|uniref:carbohydrate sulfotransferase 11-like isoform X2 n=1 Tax=Eriocheir sinensis TaxID=95602 RepID=UPI0021CA02E2|nr:carbohydrate sulfotransferase 11-like isoform X2 [Eriocheir sinensis]
MVVALTITRLRSDLKTKLRRKICTPAALGAAAIVVMLLVVKVKLLQHRNHFSAPLRSASQLTASLASASPQTNGSSELFLMSSFCVGKICKGTIPKKEDTGALTEYADEAKDATDEDFQLPTRPRARNQDLYQKDAIQQLNSTWAGSTTWVKNLLLASGTGVKKMSLHLQLRQLYPPPASAAEQERILKNSIRMIVVRHPFERLLSAYRDKMLRVKGASDPYYIMQQKVAREYGDTDTRPVPYTAAELKKASKGRHSSTGLVHPSFTQFLKKVRDDMRNLWKRNDHVNNHWQPFWVACKPCDLDYDVIAHVETLAEDQEFVIRELGLQDLLRPAHTHASRFDGYNDTSEAAESYFRKVPLELIESLAKLLRPDFEMFGYSPHKYFAMATQRQNNTTS